MFFSDVASKQVPGDISAMLALRCKDKDGRNSCLLSEAFYSFQELNAPAGRSLQTVQACGDDGCCVAA